MKKKLYIVILLFITILTCSCGSQKKEDGQVIELSDIELYDAISDKNFFIALTDEDNANNDKFLNDLNTVSKAQHKTLYYIDKRHLSVGTQIMLYDAFVYGDTLSYYYVNDTNITLSAQYTTIKELSANVSSIETSDRVKLASNEKVEEYINNAKKELSDNNYSKSLNYINNVWSKDEAKELYNVCNYYEFIKTWDNYEKKDDTYIYSIMTLYAGSDSLYIAKKESKEKYEDIVNSDYTEYKYYIKDDIIYISDNDKNYKEYAKIKSLSKNKLVLDIKGEEYIYLPNYS